MQTGRKYPAYLCRRYSITADFGIFQRFPILKAYICPLCIRYSRVFFPIFKSIRHSLKVMISGVFSNITGLLCELKNRLFWFILVYNSVYWFHTLCFRKHSCEGDVAGRKLYGQERVKHQESRYCKSIPRLGR